MKIGLLLKIRLLFCKVFGWHNGRGGLLSFDGASYCSTCSICGKKVLQDSQGNWFSVS